MMQILPAFIVLLVLPSHVYAYIDPVTGSFILQGLVAAFAAVMVFFRSVREKVLGLFGKKSSDDSDIEEADDDN